MQEEVEAPTPRDPEGQARGVGVDSTLFARGEKAESIMFTLPWAVHA